MSDILKLTILTPEKQLFKGQIKSVKISSLEGPFQILPKHMPLITILQPAITEFTDLDGKNYRAFTSSGILRIKNNKVVILCDACEWPEDIDSKRAEKARERAQERLKNDSTDIDVKRAQVALFRAITRLKLKV
jgi:F-type H+-transporting ATPase subunit epsilon